MLLIGGFKQSEGCDCSLSEGVWLMDSSLSELLKSVRSISASINLGDFLKKLLFFVTRLLPHLAVIIDTFC